MAERRVLAKISADGLALFGEDATIEGCVFDIPHPERVNRLVVRGCCLTQDGEALIIEPWGETDEATFHLVPKDAEDL